MRFFLFFYFISLSPLVSLVFIDITPFHFKKTGKKGVRVIVFDTSKQQLKRLYYIPQAASQKDEESAIKSESFSVTFSGAVTLHKPLKPDIFIRTFGGFKGRHLMKPLLPCKTPASSLKALPRLSPRDQSAQIFYSQPRSSRKKLSFQTLTSDKEANKVERGFIGERLTELTMYALGFLKINSQNKAGQGLDGVFLHPTTGALFLTESKCRNESKRASTYLKYDLSEQKIAARLREIPLKNAGLALARMIEQKPEQVFCMAQRVTSTGFVETAIRPLDFVFYTLFRYPNLKNAPANVKELFLQNLFLKLGH